MVVLVEQVAEVALVVEGDAVVLQEGLDAVSVVSAAAPAGDGGVVAACLRPQDVPDLLEGPGVGRGHPLIVQVEELVKLVAAVDLYCHGHRVTWVYGTVQFLGCLGFRGRWFPPLGLCSWHPLPSVGTGRACSLAETRHVVAAGTSLWSARRHHPWCSRRCGAPCLFTSSTPILSAISSDGIAVLANLHFRRGNGIML